MSLAFLRPLSLIPHLHHLVNSFASAPVAFRKMSACYYKAVHFPLVKAQKKEDVFRRCSYGIYLSYYIRYRNRWKNLNFSTSLGGKGRIFTLSLSKAAAKVPPF